MSITGGHRGSYRKINPQLSQTVESLQLICKGLNQSAEGWWKNEAILAAANAHDNNQEDDEEEMVDFQANEKLNEEEEDEEMVDLQAGEKFDNDSDEETVL